MPKDPHITHISWPSTNLSLAEHKTIRFSLLGSISFEEFLQLTSDDGL